MCYHFVMKNNNETGETSAPIQTERQEGGKTLSKEEFLALSKDAHNKYQNGLICYDEMLRMTHYAGRYSNNEDGFYFILQHQGCLTCKNHDVCAEKYCFGDKAYSIMVAQCSPIDLAYIEANNYRFYLAHKASLLEQWKKILKKKGFKLFPDLESHNG